MLVFGTLVLFISLNNEISKSLGFVNGDTWENPLGNFFSSDPPKKILQGEASPPIKPNDFAPVSQQDLKTPQTQDINHQETSACSSFFMRFINVMSNAISSKSDGVPETDFKKMSIDIWVSQETLNVLRKFGSGESVPYEELDRSFLSLFNHDDSYQFYNLNGVFGSASGLLNTFFQNQIFLLTLLVLSPFALFTIYLMRRGLSFVTAIRFIAFLYYVSSIALNLWIQYEDGNVRKIVAFQETLSAGGKEKIPDECFPSRMSHWQRMFNYFLGDIQCEKYLNSKKSVWSDIDLEKAFTKPVFGLLFTSLPQFGEKAGEFVKKFTDHFLFPFNWIVAVLLIYVPIKYFALSLTSVLSYDNPFSRNSSCRGHYSRVESGPEPPQEVPSSSGVQHQTVINHYHGPPLLMAGSEMFPRNRSTFRNKSSLPMIEYKKQRLERKKLIFLKRKKNINKPSDLTT